MITVSLIVLAGIYASVSEDSAMSQAARIALLTLAAGAQPNMSGNVLYEIDGSTPVGLDSAISLLASFRKPVQCTAASGSDDTVAVKCLSIESAEKKEVLRQHAKRVAQKLRDKIAERCRAPSDEVKVTVQVGAQELTVGLVDVETWLSDYWVLHSVSAESADCRKGGVSLILRIGPPAHFDILTDSL